MNGYECGMCDMSPCVCAQWERAARIKDGREAIQSICQANLHLRGWKRRVINWLWPDLLHVMDDIQEYDGKI